MVNEEITLSLASLSPFSVLFAVHRIHIYFLIFLFIWLALSNRRGGRGLMLKKAELSKSYLNFHCQSSQGLLHVSSGLCSSKYTPAQNMLFSFQCDVSDSWSAWYPLKSLAEFIPGKLLMKFVCVPVFLPQPTLLFHISCHCEEHLQFITFFKLILISNSVLQHIHSPPQPGATCKFNDDVTVTSMLLRMSSVLVLQRSRLGCQPMKSLRGLGKTIIIILEFVPRLTQ